MRSLIFLFFTLFISTNVFSQNVQFQNYDGFLSIGTQSNRTASTTLVDIDKDGDLDALIANGRHWAEQNYLFYNDGNGFFKTAQPIGTFLDGSYSMGNADFNKDGFMDISVVNDETKNKIYWGSEKNNFESESTFGNPSAPSRNLAVEDIDQDGDSDLIISNRKAVNEICLNDGNSNFTQVLNFGNKSDQTIQTKVIDINNDGFFGLGNG